MPRLNCGTLARVVGYLGSARSDTARTQIEQLSSALELYFLDVGRYPRELEGLLENDTGRDVWNGPYLARTEVIPRDPWGNDYVYTLEGQSFELMSLGADGAPGGVIITSSVTLSPAAGTKPSMEICDPPPCSIRRRARRASSGRRWARRSCGRSPPGTAGCP